MGITNMNLTEYANYKLRRYHEGDKGALGDLYEVIVKSLVLKSFKFNDVYVSKVGKADVYGKQSIEIGHNGKQWQFRKLRDQLRHPRKVIYGMITIDEFNEIVTLINADAIMQAQAIVMKNSAIFNTEMEYCETMDNLTRGKGLKTVLTKDRGELTMTIYNDSKRKAFLKALADGTLTRFEGRA